MVKRSSSVFNTVEIRRNNNKVVGVRISKKRKKNVNRQLALPMANPVHAPISGGTVFFNRPAKFQSTGNSMIVSHCEPFFSLLGGAAGVFVSAIGQLIPGNMPWLAGVAANYSKYRFRRLRIIYMPSVPTTTTGEFVVGLRYDMNDNPVATFAQAQQYYQAISAPLWAGYEGAPLLHSAFTPISNVPGSIAFDVDVTRFGYSWYKFISIVGFLALPSATDQNVYSPANIFAGDQGAPGATLMGRFYAHYECELVEPIAAALNF